jgi:hypothetical protein
LGFFIGTTAILCLTFIPKVHMYAWHVSIELDGIVYTYCEIVKCSLHAAMTYYQFHVPLRVL